MTKFKFGVVATILWLMLLAIVVYLKRNSLDEVTLNELGDFLSGSFAPVAFLWLVLGYMQQGDELKENTQALIEQKEEYSKSVELSAYTALANFETNEMNLLNSLGAKYKDGAKNARTRATEHKNKIELLLNEIQNS